MGERKRQRGSETKAIETANHKPWQNFYFSLDYFVSWLERRTVYFTFLMLNGKKKNMRAVLFSAKFHIVEQWWRIGMGWALIGKPKSHWSVLKRLHALRECQIEHKFIWNNVKHKKTAFHHEYDGKNVYLETPFIQILNFRLIRSWNKFDPEILWETLFSIFLWKNHFFLFELLLPLSKLQNHPEFTSKEWHDTENIWITDKICSLFFEN